MTQGMLVEPLQPQVITGTTVLIFKGEKIDGHTMPVDLYAKALKGLHKAFIKSNKELLGVNVTIDIVSEEEGSLKSIFKWTVCSAGAIGAALGFYAQVVTPILEFHEITGKDVEHFVHNTFIAPLQLKKDSQGDEQKLNQNLSSLSEEDKKRYNILFNNTEYRIALDDLTYFLEMSGMEELEIKSDSHSISITKNERHYFKAKLKDSIDKVTYEDTLQVVAIGKSSTWHFYSEKQNKKFPATILDDDFLEAVQNLPVEKVFKQEYISTITKTTITKVGNKSASPPTYQIHNLFALSKKQYSLIEE